MDLPPGEAFLGRLHAPPALLAMRREGPVTAMEFMAAAEYRHGRPAQRLREELAGWGLVHEEPSAINGKVISLTNAGEKVAALLEQVGEAAMRARAMVALHALLGGAMTTRGFCEATGYLPTYAKVLRDDLERWGLVVVENKGGYSHRIELSVKGRKVADVCAEIVRVVNRSAKKDA